MILLLLLKCPSLNACAPNRHTPSCLRTPLTLRHHRHRHHRHRSSLSSTTYPSASTHSLFSTAPSTSGSSACTSPSATCNPAR